MFEKRTMKTAMALVLTLASILVLTSLACPTAKTRQTPEGKSMDVGGQQTTAGNGNASLEKDDGVTGPVKVQGVGGSASAGNSKITDASVPNHGPVETLDDQNVSNVSGNHAASANIPPADGRVYPGGDEPYAYIPTYSPKNRLPIVPLLPDQ